jgi:hypothetical protein
LTITPEVVVPDIERPQPDAEGLARKLRGLEPQLTTHERRLLKRILAVAAASGIAIGIGSPAEAAPVDPAGSGETATQAVDSPEGIRAQFADAFTPGEEWTAQGSADVGLIR